VRTLASETMGAGVHQFIWNAKNEAGQSVCPGMYLYKLTAGGKTLIHRTVLAR
jgi:flagellar hook assembly protein FlgD